MGATPSKVFPAPGSYAMDNENVVAPQDPTPIIPQQQFVSMDSYSQAGAPAATTPAKPIGNGRGRNKFYGDDFDPSLYGGGPRKQTGPGTGPKFPIPPDRKPAIKIPGY